MAFVLSFSAYFGAPETAWRNPLLLGCRQDIHRHSHGPHRETPPRAGKTQMCALHQHIKKYCKVNRKVYAKWKKKKKHFALPVHSTDWNLRNTYSIQI